MHICQIWQPRHQNLSLNNHLHTPLSFVHAPRYKQTAAEFRNLSAYSCMLPGTPCSDALPKA